MLLVYFTPFFNVSIYYEIYFGNYDIKGGGAEIAVATDFRLMKEGSLIQFVQAKNGVCTGFGGF